MTLPFLKKQEHAGQKTAEHVSKQVKSVISHLPHKEPKQQKAVRVFQQVLLYVSLFLSGFIIAKIHTLLG